MVNCDPKQRRLNGRNLVSSKGWKYHNTLDPFLFLGAGDTFQAATLHWLQTEGHLTNSSKIEGEVDIQANMEFAIRAAGVTCTRKGADLPTLDDLKD